MKKKKQRFVLQFQQHPDNRFLKRWSVGLAQQEVREEPGVFYVENEYRTIESWVLAWFPFRFLALYSLRRLERHKAFIEKLRPL